MYFSGYRIKTSPELEPVSAAEVKSQLGLSGTTHDTRIELLISAARQLAERVTHRAFMNRTIEQTLDGFPADTEAVELLYPPLSSVISVEYADTDGADQTWDSSEYAVDIHSQPGRIYPAAGYNYPATYDIRNSVTITYTAGYGDNPADVNAAARQLVIALACDMFEHPEAAQELRLTENRTVKYLIDSLMIRDFY